MSRIPRPVWLLGWASLFTDAATAFGTGSALAAVAAVLLLFTQTSDAEA